MIQVIKSWWFIAVTLLIIILLELNRPVFSQSSGSITIEPAFQDVTLAANEPFKEFNFELTNKTNTSQNLKLSVVDFGGLEETGGLVFHGLTQPKADYKYALAKWIELEKQQITLAAGQTQKVLVKLINQESLSPGGHYGAILVKPQASTGRSGQAVDISPVISSLILAKKTGGEIYRMELTGVNANQSWLNLPSQINLLFKNTGNVHLVPRGLISLKDPRGKLISEATINTESGRILPETSREYKNSLTKIANGWLPGNYELTAQFRYDENDKFLTYRQTFFYLGRLTIFALIVIFIISFIMFRRRLRLLKSRKKLRKKDK